MLEMFNRGRGRATTSQSLQVPVRQTGETVENETPSPGHQNGGPCYVTGGPTQRSWNTVANGRPNYGPQNGGSGFATVANGGPSQVSAWSTVANGVHTQAPSQNSSQCQPVQNRAPPQNATQGEVPSQPHSTLVQPSKPAWGGDVYHNETAILQAQTSKEEVQMGCPAYETGAVPKIKKKNDLVQNMSELNLGPKEHSTVKFQDPPASEKQGSGGQEVSLLANYVPLIKSPCYHVYQYHVDFKPEIDSSYLRKVLLKDHKSVLGEGYIFDGMSDMKLSFKLKENPTNLFSTTGRDNLQVIISLKLTNELSSNHPEMKRLFNTQMKKNLDLMRYQRLNNEHFDIKHATQIKEYNLEDDVRMGVDTNHKFRRTDTALDIINGHKQRTNEANFRGDRSTTKYAGYSNKDLVGQIVMARYNNQTYKIEEILWSGSPRKTFDTEKGEEISYLDYYRAQYDLKIKDPDQPLIVCEKEVTAPREKKYVNLVPELCIMTGRVFKPEDVTQRAHKYLTNEQDEDFSRQMLNKPLLESKPFENWAIVYANQDRETVVPRIVPSVVLDN